MLKISNSILEAICAHARAELPNEACGYLAASEDKVVAHYELTNIDYAADHFSMAPEEQFAAVKNMRSRGLTLRAVYHSHPETPARPSVEDIKLAHDPEISYLIVSLAEAKVDVKSFRIVKGEVRPEEIEIVESPVDS